MNTKKKASKRKPVEVKPIAMANAGDMKAIFWKTEEGVQFFIGKDCPKTAELCSIFEAEDVVNLAQIIVMVADALCQIGDASSELCDDLGCLAHSLALALGMAEELPFPQETLQ